MYGSEESLKVVFECAQQFCEPMPVYQQLADIYAKSKKTKVPSTGCICLDRCGDPVFCRRFRAFVTFVQEAEGLYKTMVKRFRQNKAVRLSYGTFLLQQGQSDGATVLLQRALKSLPTKARRCLIV
ncbi:protein RRP5 homolog isoform X1 [Gasterosteus aculeatus]